MSRFKFSKKLSSAIAISIAVGLVLGLSSSVSALRRIDNRVDINAPAIPLGELGTSSASSGDYAFEKGDAIYRRFNFAPFITADLSPHQKALLYLWSHMGHCGLYRYWEPDENSDPTIKKNHKTIESYLARPLSLDNPFKGAGVHDNYDFQYFVDSAGYWGRIWGVRTSDRLTAEKRLAIIETAMRQRGCSYRFFAGYKRPGVSFRDDGFVEYCYEIALGDEWKPGKNGGIVKNDFFKVRKGCRVLYPRRQFNSLNSQDNAFFPMLIFGKLEGVVMREPIWIEGVEIHPEDGRYEVYGDGVEVNIHASDIDWDNDGSGITRVQLWVGEPDDTPEEMPGFRIMGDDDDEDYPADHDYIYIWDTTKKEDGETLFPNGDYTLKAIGFDQAGNNAEAELAVEVANAEKYLYVRVEPCFVETDGSDDTQTESFTIYVEAWNPGSGGTTPEDGVNKKEGTQSYKIVDGKPVLETCYTDQVEEATKDSTFNGIVNISTLFSDIDGISLYKEGWDGTIEVTNGSGNVSGVRYETDDGSGLDDSGQILVKAEGEGIVAQIKGNSRLIINPTQIFLSEGAWVGMCTWPDAPTSYIKSTGNLFMETARYSDHYSNARIFLKWDSSSAWKLFLYLWGIYNPYSGGGGTPKAVDVYEVDKSAWNQGSITWQNQPDLGALMDSEIFSDTGWKKFKVENIESVCLKFRNEFTSSGSYKYHSAQFRGITSLENPAYVVLLP